MEKIVSPREIAHDRFTRCAPGGSDLPSLFFQSEQVCRLENRMTHLPLASVAEERSSEIE